MTDINRPSGALPDLNGIEDGLDLDQVLARYGINPASIGEASPAEVEFVMRRCFPGTVTCTPAGGARFRKVPIEPQMGTSVALFSSGSLSAHVRPRFDDVPSRRD
jgi:hypothetical protein